MSPSSGIRSSPSRRVIDGSVAFRLQNRRKRSSSLRYTTAMRVSSVSNPSSRRDSGTRMRRSKSVRSEPSSLRSLPSSSASRRSAFRQKSMSVDLPVPRPPIIAFSQGLNATVIGDCRPMNLASLTVMRSMARAAWAFGLPGASRTAGLRESGPSSNARRRPSKSGRVIFTQVKRRPRAAMECPSELHTRENLRRISGMLPSSHLSSISLSGLTSSAARFRFRSTASLCWPSRPSSPSGPLTWAPTISASSPHRSRIFFDAERRSSRLMAALLDGNLHSGEKVIDMLATTTRVHQQEQVDAVASGDLDAGKENRSVIQARDGLLQLGDACGGVVIGDCRGIETRVANCLHPLGPVRVCPVGFGLEVMRRRGVGMEIDSPPTGTGPVPRCAHVPPPVAPSPPMHQDLIAAAPTAPTTPQSRS